MKKSLIILFVFCAFLGNAQIGTTLNYVKIDSLQARVNSIEIKDTVKFENPIYLKDSMLISVTAGDTIATKEYVDINSGSSLSVGTDGQIPYTNAAGDDFIYNDYLKYDGNKLKFNTDTTEIKGVTKADTIVSDVIKGAMQIAKAEVLYTNTTQTTIITLPENAVVWHFGVEVNTIFNDSGTDYLELGTSTNSTEYDNNVDLGISNFFFDSNISFSPDRPVKMTSSTDITFKYAGQNSDATTGQAFVYIHYTIF